MRLYAMRIAFIGQKGIPVSQGGVERHVEELARHLVMRGHTVLAYNRTTYKTGGAALPAGVKTVSVPSVPIKGWDTIIASLLSTIDVLFRKVDVIHFHSMGPAFFIILPRLFRPGVKTCFTHHTYETERPQWGRLARLAMRLGEIVGMRLADEVIAISPTVAMDLERRFNRRVSTVPSGASKLVEGAGADALALPEKYILAVSRLIRSKGIDHLINAFNLIQADYPDYHLVIVGSPTHNDNDALRLRSLAAGNAKIRFLGWQPSSRLARIYRRATIFVQPSEIEGLPISLLEAASAGLPVIASDIPEHKVVVRSQALTFRSGNYIDLAAKLRFLLSNLPQYRQLAARLAKRVEAEFNWEKLTRRVEKVYGYPTDAGKDLATKPA